MSCICSFHKKNDRRAGFSLAEVMVAMLAGSILALVVGTMLVSGYSSWRYQNSALEQQRDASLAMETIGREIRESGIGDIRIGGASFSASPTALGSTIAFDSNMVRSNRVSISVSGDRLVYNPGNFNLVRSGVQRFSAQFNPNGPRIHVILQLFDPDLGSTIMEGSFRTRND